MRVILRFRFARTYNSPRLDDASSASVATDRGGLGPFGSLMRLTSRNAIPRMKAEVKKIAEGNVATVLIYTAPNNEGPMT